MTSKKDCTEILIKFTKLKELKDSENYVKIEKGEFIIFSKDSYYGKIINFFKKKYNWKPYETRFKTVLNETVKFYNIYLQPNLKNLSHNQIEEVNETLDIINNRWLKNRSY